MEVELETRKRLARKSRGRKLLRGFTAAALCAPLGALTGAVLGVVFACLVFAAYAYMRSRAVGIGGPLGGITGGLAGVCIGFTVTIPDDRKRTGVAIGIGLVAGVVLALLSRLVLVLEVAGPMVVSGLVGGWFLAVALTTLRRHWSWWTRWEAEEALAAGRSVPDGSA